MKQTLNLKMILARYKELISELEYTSFEKEVDRLIQQYFDHLMKYKAGVERGQETHRLLEIEIQKSADVQESCKKGCGFCCHLEVQITQDDAEVLVRSIYEGKKIDFDNLRKLSMRAPKDALWSRGAVAENRCVFLGDDNACTNYENRPTTCRKYAVVSPVEECATVGGHPVPKLIPMVEIIQSAAMNLPFNSIGVLPKFVQMILDDDNAKSIEHEAIAFVPEAII